MLRCVWLTSAAIVVGAETTTIYKVDYPVKDLCGQESNVEKSALNPHWLFPMTFGGFQEGNCSDVGYTKFKETKVIEMNPVPWVHHNLSFDLYEPSQTKLITISFTDPSRNDRVVRAKFCMPRVSGKLPLYIFGHGAGCNPEDYLYFCQVAATAMIYQDSPAGPIFPVDFDSATAALDAAFLSKKLPHLSTSDPSSLLFGRLLGGMTILGGHSMGGGMTILAAGKDAAASAGLAIFEPGLYTKPDGTPFLKNITVPALVVSSSLSCGQNALEKQARPAFDGLASRSKVLVVVKGGNHCQWTQPFEKGIGICKTFVKECHTIERAEQHQLGIQLVQAFVDGLKSDEGWGRFEGTLSAGEAAGSWTYVSSRTSPPGKAVHTDCPCSPSGEVNLVV